MQTQTRSQTKTARLSQEIQNIIQHPASQELDNACFNVLRDAAHPDYPNYLTALAETIYDNNRVTYGQSSIGRADTITNLVNDIGDNIVGSNGILHDKVLDLLITLEEGMGLSRNLEGLPQENVQQQAQGNFQQQAQGNQPQAQGNFQQQAQGNQPQAPDILSRLRVGPEKSTDHSR